MWPLAYPLTALALLFNYACTKCAVAYWYKKPPMVSEEMMTKLRSRLGFLMFLHSLVAFVGSHAVSAKDGNSLNGSAPVAVMFIVWAIYEIIDLPDCLDVIPGLRAFDELTAGDVGGEGDTQGIPLRTDGDKPGVLETKGYPVEECAPPSTLRSTLRITLRITP